jgi:4-amino-4-deoxy-L-arabinose transferase-like glycosyltransferase
MPSIPHHPVTTSTAHHADRRGSWALVVGASIACLAVGFAPMPLWDEDEPRFAAIARTMLATGDWVVPSYNGTLAVDKPVLMHWCMATAFALFGPDERAARLPAAVATLLAALALWRAGSRWFSPATGVTAALAFVGCLLVGIEAHAATPDAILTAATAWATVLAAEPLIAATSATARLSMRRALAVGGLCGLAVLCKGPIGLVGPAAVLGLWAWGCAAGTRVAASGQRGPREVIGGLWDATVALRPLAIGVGMLAVAAPWYAAVSIRTGGEWPAGFFLVHNIGRFAAPMENHRGGLLFHVVGMLVGFFPWSCFLPLSVVLAGRRVAHGGGGLPQRRALALGLVWLTVWLVGFSLSATKLPNYVLPAYPAAALLVAALAVDACRQTTWPHPRWLTAGVVSLALGGVATAATVLVASRHGLSDAEAAAAVGIIPVVGALACWWLRNRSPNGALAALVLTGLVYTGLAVGPAARRIATSNALPELVEAAHRHAGGTARLAAFPQNTPTIVYYARGQVREYAREQVREWPAEAAAAAADFLRSGPDAVLIVPADHLTALEPFLPPRTAVVGRRRPLFKDQDFCLVGTFPDAGAAVGNAPARLHR